jgi:hypothetical protein
MHPVMASPPQPAGEGAARTVTLKAQLDQLNGSGAFGTATATVRNQKIQHVAVHAKGLTPDAPHAQHIHYGGQALNECPALAQDSNDDGRVNTVEGVPAYGPVVVSLTTSGDTTPASFLDVTRFPVSVNGSYDYSRANLTFTRVAGTGYSGGGSTAKQIADAVRDGEVSSSSTGWTTTATASTTSARVPASSTPACPPTRPPVACSRSSSDPRFLRSLTIRHQRWPAGIRWAVANVHRNAYYTGAFRCPLRHTTNSPSLGKLLCAHGGSAIRC